jgi:hypothetical protein
VGAESSVTFPTVPVVIAAVVLLLIVVGATAYVLMRCRTVYETEYETEEMKGEPDSIAFTDDKESLAEVYFENPGNESDGVTITMLQSDCDIGDVSDVVVT